MSRLRPLILVSLLSVSQAAHADHASWAPNRLGLGAAVLAPLNTDYVLTDLRLDLSNHVGIAVLDGNRATGPIAGVGGRAGIGLFTPAGGAMGCEDEIDPEDGSKRPTCGRLTLGGSLMIGWAWGGLLKSGYAAQERTVFVRATPYLAIAKSPVHSGGELDIEVAAGFWTRRLGLELLWSRVPGDDFIGVGIGLTAAMSEWFVKDELVEPEVERPKPVSERRDLRFELGAGFGVAARRAHTIDDGAGQVHLAIYQRYGEHDGGFVALGGGMSFLADSSNGVHLGPAVEIGTGGSSAGVYARLRPLIGGRTIDSDARFDYGAEAAVGFGVGLGDDDDDPAGEKMGSAFGLEVNSTVISGDVYVGANMMLLAW